MVFKKLRVLGLFDFWISDEKLCEFAGIIIESGWEWTEGTEKNVA